MLFSTGGPHLTEPMTMVTDYMLTIESVALAVALYRKVGTAGTAPLWVAAFLVTALASLAGGTAHGFAPYLGPTYHALLWKLVVWSLAASAGLMIASGVRSVLRPVAKAPLRRKAGHKWLWSAVLITFTGLAIQRSGWALHQDFNHNDLYHVVQMAALYCLYRGAFRLNQLSE